MTFPSSPALDTFNAGASQALTARVGWFGTVRASGGMSTDPVPTFAVGTAGVVGGNIWNTLFPADQEVWVTLKSTPGAGGVQLEARFDPVGGNGYALIYTGGSLEIVELDSFGGGVQIGSSFAVTPVAGDQLGMRCQGTTIAGFYNGAQVISGTNAVYNVSGKIDVLTFGSPATQIDTFGGGAIGSAGAGNHNEFLLSGVG